MPYAEINELNKNQGGYGEGPVKSKVFHTIIFVRHWA